MAPKLLTLALISSCAAFTIPTSYNATKTVQPGSTTQAPAHEHEWVTVHIRADSAQNVHNPDSEPTYTDQVSGEAIQKSQILKGVGPPEAEEHRYFDWDETCTDANDRQMIFQAWQNFQPLVDTTTQRLTTLAAGYPEPGKAEKTNAKNEKYIKQTDPAFTQMFNARSGFLSNVKQAFESITAGIKSIPNRPGNDPGPPALRFVCDKHAQVKDQDGGTLCTSGAQAPEAQTFLAQSATDKNIEIKHRLSTASTIVFCPPFFDDTYAPTLNSILGSKPADYAFTLPEVNCKDRIMLHEYLHLKWTSDLFPGEGYDDIGWEKIAISAKKLRIDDHLKKPDAYAWYALYSFFNNYNGQCNDIWPKGVKRPTSRT
ncbi:hypothetical protein B0A48_11093 [Cryoendolithus antarcticus]|uniref:Lysine-specific metallo-endopeptidase domain-containing protein n=1 Tax=Cryoendolithus antarcticus TaxID=1507870 RepID=A0A1V8SUT4_9PEZI|nr:hypothetical protein B0A48_11093 [Cryoendolithus antarcticus]